MLAVGVTSAEVTALPPIGVMVSPALRPTVAASRVDADHLTLVLEQRTTLVAGNDVSVGLDQALQGLTRHPDSATAVIVSSPVTVASAVVG